VLFNLSLGIRNLIDPTIDGVINDILLSSVVTPLAAENSFNCDLLALEQYDN
jgi:hypothetical protein